MNRKIDFSPENYYHVYNRGTDKRNIFTHEDDYKRFLGLLYICNNTENIDWRELIPRRTGFFNIFTIKRKETLVDVGLYCLMPNHFHLLLRERVKKGISIFMKKMCTAYAMYFNKKNNRSGNLFQGKFKAELADKDEYLKYLFSYIHLNPIKLIEPKWKEIGIKDYTKAVEFLNKYQWSSYRYYTGTENENHIINKNSFPDYFENLNDFNVFIKEWLTFPKFPKVGPSEN